MASRRFETATLPLLGKQGLFPGIERRSGIRKFGENELKALRMIECLKMSRLEIKDIKQFMDWCVEGASTYPLRRELLEKQKETVEAEIAHMNKVLDMLRFKCWYYDQAIQDGMRAIGSRACFQTICRMIFSPSMTMHINKKNVSANVQTDIG